MLRMFLMCLLLPVAQARALAGVRPQEKGAEKPAEEAKAKPAAEEEKEEAEEDRWFAVRGGEVHTVTEGVLRGATVLAKNGRIHRIGYDVEIPEGADVIDATGMRVYPGLLALNSSGLVGGNPERDTDVFSLNLTLGLASGLTSVVTGDSVAKLTYGTLEGLLLQKGLWVRLNFRNASGRRQLRESFQKIREFQREFREYERRKAAGEKVEEPKPQGLNQQHRDLLEGKRIARFDADGAHELTAIARLVQDYHFRAVVFGAREGWVVADEMGRAGVSCIVSPRTPRARDTRRNRPNGATIENAAILHRHGVPVAVLGGTGISLGGLVGRDLLTLPMDAAFAVRGGLPRQAALEAITINSARIAGVDHRIGSLEVGKDADLIITDGDLLHYRTLVYYAVVNGRLAYDKATETLLSHIRPRESTFQEGEELLKALEEIHPPAEEEGEESESSEAEGGEGSGDGSDGGAR